MFDENLADAILYFSNIRKLGNYFISDGVKSTGFAANGNFFLGAGHFNNL